MSRLPIEDYYGTELEVEVVGCSVGQMVDLTSAGSIDPAASDFHRLTPQKARDLAKRLTDAVDEIEGRL